MGRVRSARSAFAGDQPWRGGMGSADAAHAIKTKARAFSHRLTFPSTPFTEVISI